MKNSKLLLNILIISLFGLSVFAVIRKNEEKNTALKFVSVAPVISDQNEKITNELNDSEQLFSLEKYVVKSAPVDDTLIIDKDSFIDVFPLDKKIEKAKKVNEEGFYVAADDYNHYSYLAGEFLKDKPIEKFYPKKRYLKFIGENKTTYIDTQSDLSDLWLTILFTPSKLPKIISLMNIENEYAKYFTDNTQLQQ